MTEPTNTNAPASVPGPGPTVADTLLLSVADALKASLAGGATSALFSSITDVFVKREQDRRIALLVGLFDKLKVAEKALSDIDKPDMVFTIAGAKTEGQTPKRIGEVEKAKGTVKRLKDAITAALLQANFEPAEKLAKEQPGGNAKPDAEGREP